jgi:hypothetical protein
MSAGAGPTNEEERLVIDPIRELKIRAELLQHARQNDDSTIQRKDCLAEVARAAGFASWPHALRVLEGDEPEPDFGTSLYPSSWGGSRLNHWFASYDEARAHVDASGGYLLAYKRQFFVCDRHFVEALGLDPDDADWRAIGFDWARPADKDARKRLYGKLLASQRAA